MDGVHDLGGAEGFGRIGAEPDEPVFRSEWERRICGLTMATFLAGLSNGGEFRHGIERMEPVHYLTSRYYEHWFTSVATRAVEVGVLSREELENRAGGRVPLAAPPLAAPIDAAAVGDSTTAPRFTVGSEVRVRQWHPRGHTRCPRYVRGKVGTVVRVDGAASVPDIEAHSPARRSEPIYSVRFKVDDLWGDTDRSGDAVHVDLWESYLQ